MKFNVALKDENTTINFFFFNFICIKSEIIKIEFSSLDINMTDNLLNNGNNQIIMRIEDENNTVFEYDYNNNKINGNIKNPQIILTIPIFFLLYKFYLYINEQLEGDLNKNNVKIIEEKNNIY